MAQLTPEGQAAIDNASLGSYYNPPTYNPLSYAQPGAFDNYPVTISSYLKPMINAPAPPIGDLLCPYGCSTAERSGVIGEPLGNSSVTLGNGRSPISTSFAPLPISGSTSTTAGKATMEKYLTGKNILIAIVAYVAAKHFKVI